MGLCFVRRRHLKMLQRPNDRFSVGVKQGFPVERYVKPWDYSRGGRSRWY